MLIPAMARRHSNKYAISRKTRNSLTALIAVLILAFSLADRLFVNPKVSTAVSGNQQLADFENLHNKEFIVPYVVDGDTFDIDYPDKNFKHTRIRLLGIDTPETKKPNTPVMHFGPEASEKTKQLILNKRVIILLDSVSKTRDKYGRLLCYAKLSDDRILNELLVEGGFAYADLRFQHSFYSKYESLMKKARKNKIGLWQNITFEQFPGWLKKIRPDWQ